MRPERVLEALTPGRHAIGDRWVFAHKRDESGRVVKYKARLVARGFSQRPGYDFKETFALVMHFETLGSVVDSMDKSACKRSSRSPERGHAGTRMPNRVAAGDFSL